MAIKPFAIQGSDLTLGGVNLQAGTTTIVIPGVTQAANYFVEEVDERDGANPNTFGSDANAVVVIDNAEYVYQSGSQASADYASANYMVNELDDGKIEEINVESEGVFLTADKTFAEAANMWATTVVDPFVSFNAGDWTQIPFRPKIRAGEVTNVGGGSGGVVEREINFPEGEEGDTSGTLALTPTGSLFICTTDWTDVDDINKTFVGEAVRDFAAGQSGFQYNFIELLVADHPGLETILNTLNAAGVDYQTDFTVNGGGDFGGAQTISQIGFGNNGTEIVIGWPHRVGVDPTTIDQGDEFTVIYTGTVPQPAIWQQLNTDNPLGDLTIEFGNEITNGNGDILIVADDDIRLDATDEISIRTSGTANGNYVEVITGYDSNDQHRWKFDTSGNLTLPEGGDILDSNGDSVLGGGVTDNNIWVETFTSDAQTTDFVQAATSVEYDASGNIFALFNHSIPTPNSETYTSVAKLSPAGTVLWQVRFSVNLNTDGWGLAYDGVDSVYIAGRTSGTPLTYEFATLTKIDAVDGTIVWSKTYDFEANSSSAVVDVGSDLNPIMVGYAYNGTDNYIVTTKVDSADGLVIWCKTIDGQNDDEAYGMAVGPTGEVVTIGYVDSYGPTDGAATLYTDPVSNVNWVSNAQISVGNFSCNVTFADGVPTFTNIVDPEGNRTVDDIIATVSVASFVGSGGSNAEFDISVSGASALATITTTDLATATATGTTVKNTDNIVTPGGWGNWLVFPDSALRVTLEGLFTMNQVIPATWGAGSTSLTGFVMIQFPGDGTFQITPVEEGGGNAVPGTWYFDLTFDGTNSYSTLVTNGGTNYQVGHRIKILGSGLGGVDVTNDAILTVATVTSGVIDTVTITGTATGAAATYTSVTGTNYTDNTDDMIIKVATVAANDNDDRMVVIKYSAGGTIAWQKAVQFDAGYSCSGADADIDADGNIYVCGQYQYDYNSYTTSAMSLAKFDSSGVKQWSRRVVGNCDTFATSVVVGPDNYLYLSGVTGNDTTDEYTWVVAKYNTFGVVEWQRLIDNTTSWSFSGAFWFSSNGGGSNIAVGNGYVALAGAFGNPGTQPKATIVQIDTAATEFSVGDWDIKAATFSGLLDDSASDITVVDAGKTEGNTAPTAADFATSSDSSNFLSATRAGADSGDSINNGAYSVSVGADGSVTFPTLTVPLEDNANPVGTGQVLQFSDSTQQAIIFGPVSTVDYPYAERIIIQGAPGYTGTNGEGGDVYVWAGPGGSANGQGGDIKVRAGKGIGSGPGGYLNLQAGDSNTGYGGYINIESGETGTAGQGGYIAIQARNGGDINLSTVQSGTISVQTAGGALTVGGVTAQVGSSLVIADDGGGGLIGWGSQALAIAYDANIMTAYPIGSTITWQDGTVATITAYDPYAPTYIDVFWDTPKTGTLFPITLKTSNYADTVFNPTSITVSANTWTFAANGSTTLPGAITRVVAGTVAKTGVILPTTTGTAESLTSDSVLTGLTDAQYGPFTLGTVTFSVAVNGGVINNFVSVSSTATVTINDVLGTIDSGDIGGTAGTTITVTVNGVVQETPTALDLTKSINKLTSGAYTLADGVEGQIMYLVPQNGITVAGNVGVNVANFRTSDFTGESGPLLPFRIYNGVDLMNSTGICTLIFTDSAWQQTGGAWD